MDKPTKHLRLLEPTKTAQALHRILTRGWDYLVLMVNMQYYYPSDSWTTQYLWSPHFRIWLSWPNFFNSKHFIVIGTFRVLKNSKKVGSWQMPFALFSKRSWIRSWIREFVEKLSHGFFPSRSRTRWKLRCSSCPEFTTSPQGSNAVTHCTCTLARTKTSGRKFRLTQLERCLNIRAWLWRVWVGTTSHPGCWLVTRIMHHL